VASPIVPSNKARADRPNLAVLLRYQMSDTNRDTLIRGYVRHVRLNGGEAQAHGKSAGNLQRPSCLISRDEGISRKNESTAVVHSGMTSSEALK